MPSLTEALAVTVPDRLVGATDWCTHPAGLDVARVRGTKNPDRAAIAALAPDLVIANQEENRAAGRAAAARRAGVPVWVTVIESLDQALRLDAPAVRPRCSDVGGAGLAARRRGGVGAAGTGAGAAGRRPDLARPVDGGGQPHVRR